MKTKNIFLTVALALCTTFAFAQNITGSKHDFRVQSFNPTSGGSAEICITCHTPHNAISSANGAPLWNHAESVETFTPYADNGTLDASVAAPTGTSKLCLSCHDGTTNLDAIGTGVAGTAALGSATFYPTTTADLGTNLTTHHPVSFTYDDALAAADGGLHPPTSTTSGITGNIDADMLFGAGNDRLECSSCHDVHNGANLAGLLVKTNNGSALCLTCHNK